MTYKNGHNDLGFMVGLRNSYDKSMSAGIAIGAKVFVCDNLCFSGDITIMRKHTGNAFDELTDQIISILFKNKHMHKQISEQVDKLKEISCNTNDGFHLMGELFGKGVITPTQISLTKKEWIKPKHEEFRPRNMWSFYNSVTESLKTCSPMNIVRKHAQLHENVMNWVN